MSFLAALVFAQSAVVPASPIFDKAQHLAALDSAFEKRDYNQIVKIALEPKSSPETLASLDWLGAKFKQGSSPAIALTYSRLLNAIAASEPGKEGNGLRGTALAALIYAAASSSVEDRQCADKTAWGNRLMQMAPYIQQSGLRDLDDETRRFAAAIALQIEKNTWDRRKAEDDAAFLCMNGMRAITAGLAAGAVREEKPTPGQIGRQVKVTVPSDFKYERRSDAEWWTEAEALRAQLPNLVLQLAGVDRLPTADERPK